jgi:hypothetical protein
MTVAARMHVNAYRRVLDEVFGLGDTVLGSSQGQGFRGLRHDGHADRSDGGTTEQSPKNAAAINFSHHVHLV